MVGVYIHAILVHLQMYLQRPHKAHNILTTVMTNIVVDNSTDNAEPLPICYFTNRRSVFVARTVLPMSRNTEP